jgi:hypothetical protein
MHYVDIRQHFLTLNFVVLCFKLLNAVEPKIVY